MRKTFISKDKDCKITRVSRWIRIQTAFDITKKHSLFDYCDKTNENSIDYFRYNGRKYAVNQFFRLIHPIFFDDTNGKTNFISGYDSENYWNPYYIEIDDCGEYVRMYEIEYIKN